MPLRVTAGTSTLLVPNVGVVLKAGYGNGFYDAGESFSSYVGQAEVRWAIAPTIRVAGGYQHDFTDSLIGNYYSDHTFYARASMLVAGRWQARAKLSATARSFANIINPTGPGADVQFCTTAVCPRSDFLFGGEASLDYQLMSWLVLGASWHIETDTTSFSTRNLGDGAVFPSGFVWNELLVRGSAKF
jgi:hypothetical protein